MYKITPHANKSHLLPYLLTSSLRLITSGATYPGVPHFGNGKLYISSVTANPKSIIFSELKLPTSSNIILSGLMSRWMIFFECI